MEYTFNRLESSYQTRKPEYSLLLQALVKVRLLAAEAQFDLRAVCNPQSDRPARIECGAVCCVIGAVLLDDSMPHAGWRVDQYGTLINPDGSRRTDSAFDQAGADIFNLAVGDAFDLFGPVRSAERDPVTGPGSDYQVFEARLRAFFEWHNQPFEVPA